MPDCTRKTVCFFFVLIIAISGCGKKLIIDQSIRDKIALREIKTRYQSENWEVRIKAVQEIPLYISTPESQSFFQEKYRQSNTELIVNLLLSASLDIHPAVRIEVLKCMARLSDPAVLKRVREMAANESNDNVRWYAVKLLSQYRNLENLEIFLTGLNSEDWLIREASITGLCMIDMKEAAVKDEIIPYLIISMNDSNESVRIATLENIKITNDKLYEQIKEFISGRKKNSNVKVLKAALQALKGYPLDDETRQNVIGLFAHYDKDVRILALRVLKSDGGKK